MANRLEMANIQAILQLHALQWSHRRIARRLGVEPRLRRMRLQDARLRAERPLYCALSNAKLAAAGISMPTWQDAVGRYVTTLR